MLVSTSTSKRTAWRSSSRQPEFSMSADLRRLADVLGIAADYEDIWGRRHETGDLVRRALLGAMGIAADSDRTGSAAGPSAARE